MQLSLPPLTASARRALAQAQVKVFGHYQLLTTENFSGVIQLDESDADESDDCVS